MLGEYRNGQSRPPHPRGMAIAASLLTHVTAAMVVMSLTALPRSVESVRRPRMTTVYDLVWIASPGDGGGGGGGGNQTPVAAPARQVGRDRLTVPTRPPAAPADAPDEPPIAPPLTVPAKPMAAATDFSPGAIDPVPTAGLSQGPGSDGGAGTGRGGGSGAGEGSGLGPGSGGGTGGGVFRPGSGVSMPEVVREVKPNYTLDAMRAKLQGLVVLECVVLPDGTVGDVKVVKSLDKVFGLDEQAIKAVKEWRFLPGRRFGEPVPVYVTIELAFTLR